MKPKFSKKFEQLIDFVNFTHEFREIVRVARSPNGKRYENDVEHSYQVAMVAWFLIDQDKLKLNKELCLMYALAHDLVEVYAGDTYVFDNKHKESKVKREKEALKKIKKRFSNFRGLTDLIEKYEKKEDNESKFIYALDKIVTPLQIFLEDGKLWHENNVTLELLLEYKSKKIALSPDIDKYWTELRGEIIKQKSKLFPSKSKSKI
jgi:5'-deoxynucleotidase YfbR-like HD superfamily hydrolase